MGIINKNIAFIIFYTSVFLLLLVSKIGAQKISYGNCPSIEPMADIYLRRYMGLWYQHASFRPFWRMFKKCVTFNYTIGERGVFYIKSSYQHVGNNKPKLHFAVANPEEYHGLPLQAGFEVKYFNWFGNATGFTNQLYVLNTDYDSYSVEYSCVEVMFIRIQRLQILVRNTKMDPDVVLEKAKATLKLQEIDFY